MTTHEHRHWTYESIGPTLDAVTTTLPHHVDELAISIHTYGTDVTRLGSSARRYYD